MTAALASYPIVGCVATNTHTPQPRQLPAELEGYYSAIVNLSHSRGYAWFKASWAMREWGIKRWKFYSIIRKLQAFGRLIVEEVAGSHERRLIPIPLTRRDRSAKHRPEPETKTAQEPGSRHESREPARRAADQSPSTSESQNTSLPIDAQPIERDVALPPGAEVLVERGLEAQLAIDLVEEIPLGEIHDALRAFDEYRERSEVRYPVRALIDAIRKRWKPARRPEATSARQIIVESPAPAPVTSELLDRLRGRCPGLVRSMEKHAPGTVNGDRSEVKRDE